MSQQIMVDREIVLRGAAAYRPNVDGRLMSKMKIIDFGFEGTSTLYGWSSTTGANGCTLAHASVDGGAMTMTMGGTLNDCGEFYHTAQWSAAKNCGMQAKLKISQITVVNVCVGFVDAYTNTNDRVALEMTSAALTDCVNTADAAGIVFDTNSSADVFYGAAVNATAEGTPKALVGTLIPTANTYFYVRIQTDSSGNVTFYYGTEAGILNAVGYLPAAIAFASTDMLAPYIGFIARDTTAQVCTISRVTVWQDN